MTLADDLVYWYFEEKRFRVYYCRNAAGAIVYIGYTGGWKERKKAHGYATEWWPEVERVTFSPWLNRRNAQVREGQAIRRHRPRYNVQHNPDAIRRAALAGFGAEHVEAVLAAS